jgi:hypothetical protein
MYSSALFSRTSDLIAKSFNLDVYAEPRRKHDSIPRRKPSIGLITPFWPRSDAITRRWRKTVRLAVLQEALA